MEDKLLDREAQKVEKILEKVLREQGKQAILHYAKINRHWEVIIGSSLAKKTAPLKLLRRTLTILVEDAAYAHHLKYFEKNILDLIASPEICGEGAVTKVVFRVGTKSFMKEHAEQTNSNQSQIKKEMPKILAIAKETASNINDKSLEKAFARCMSKIVTKKSESP